MKLSAIFEVIDVQNKSGTSKAGQPYSINEYLLKCVEKRDDGSELETVIPATASERVGNLQKGASYDCSIFVNSHQYNERYLVSFRVTFAKKVSDAPAPATEPVAEEVSTGEPVGVADDVPF